MKLIHVFSLWAKALFRHHVLGSCLIVLLGTFLIASQVMQRDDFANSELGKEVELRWGAPVAQAAPSLRYVQSGSIFTELKALPFDKQNVRVEAKMNYRKRGLRYFSGFDFSLVGNFSVVNPEPNDIDVAFIFPIEVDKSQVLLSELSFLVNGQPRDLDLGKEGNRLTWTGRIPRGAQAEFQIRYRARGLNEFIYKMDPLLRARQVHVEMVVQGGDNIDYPENVLPAHQQMDEANGTRLVWDFPSLESGVNLGMVLPSMTSFDGQIATMAIRSNVTFVGFLVLLIAISLRHQRKLLFYETYLLAATFAFSFILLAYFAAFMNFYVAYVLSMALTGLLLVFYLSRLFRLENRWLFLAVWISTGIIPTLAVLFEGFTGLIYTLELLAILIGLMRLSLSNEFRQLFAPTAEVLPSEGEAR